MVTKNSTCAPQITRKKHQVLVKTKRTNDQNVTIRKMQKQLNKKFKCVCWKVQKIWVFLEFLVNKPQATNPNECIFYNHCSLEGFFFSVCAVKNVCKMWNKTIINSSFSELNGAAGWRSATIIRDFTLKCSQKWRVANKKKRMVMLTSWDKKLVWLHSGFSTMCDNCCHRKGPLCHLASPGPHYHPKETL